MCVLVLQPKIDAFYLHFKIFKMFLNVCQIILYLSKQEHQEETRNAETNTNTIIKIKLRKQTNYMYKFIRHPKYCLSIRWKRCRFVPLYYIYRIYCLFKVINTDSFDASMYIHAYLVLPNHLDCACKQREKERLFFKDFIVLLCTLTKKWPLKKFKDSCNGVSGVGAGTI